MSEETALQKQVRRKNVLLKDWDALEDEDFQRLSELDRYRIFHAIKLHRNGKFETGSDAEIARKLWITVDEWQGTVSGALSAGVLASEHKFREIKAKDSSAKRTRRWRARKKLAQCDANKSHKGIGDAVTLIEQDHFESVTLIRNNLPIGDAISDGDGQSVTLISENTTVTNSVTCHENGNGNGSMGDLLQFVSRTLASPANVNVNVLAMQENDNVDVIESISPGHSQLCLGKHTKAFAPPKPENNSGFDEIMKKIPLDVLSDPSVNLEQEIGKLQRRYNKRGPEYLAYSIEYVLGYEYRNFWKYLTRAYNDGYGYEIIKKRKDAAAKAMEEIEKDRMEKEKSEKAKAEKAKRLEELLWEIKQDPNRLEALREIAGKRFRGVPIYTDDELMQVLKSLGGNGRDPTNEKGETAPPIPTDRQTGVEIEPE